MKKFLMYFGVMGLLLLPAQGAFAWQGIQSLNPLPYVGIGPNYSTFSLNPFTGFRNCHPCKKVEKCNPCEKKVEKCNTCVTGAAAPICPKCVKAFPKCETCNKIIVPAQKIYVAEPKCPCMKKRY